MEFLPEELKFKICENLSTEDLGRLAQTSWNQYNICLETLKDKITDDILSTKTIEKRYTFVSGDSTITLDIFEAPANPGFVNIYITQKGGKNWLFPDIKYYRSGVPVTHFQNFNWIRIDRNQIREIVDTLFKNGYLPIAETKYF